MHVSTYLRVGAFFLSLGRDEVALAEERRLMESEKAAHQKVPTRNSLPVPARDPCSRDTCLVS